MLGLIWYRSKALRVLRDQYDYNPAVPGSQAAVFNACIKQVRTNVGNEYDAAIAFMLIQMDALVGKSDSNDRFIDMVVRRSYYCAERAESEMTREVADSLYSERFESE